MHANVSGGMMRFIRAAAAIMAAAALTVSCSGTEQAAREPAEPTATTVTIGVPDPPFITAVDGTGTASHFVDQYGDPILIRGDTVWALPFNAGRWGGGTTWQSDIDNYIAARAAQGYNVVYYAALGSIANNGVSDDGDTWDSVSPWDTDPGTLNDTYWERVDRIVTAAADAGVTCFFDAIYGAEGMDPALEDATEAQFGNYGTALGNRYKDYPNIVWALGGDFWGELSNHDAKMDQWFANLRATGDTHLVSIENKPEMSSRFDATDTVQLFGTAHAQYNSVYTYNVTYWMIEYALAESSPLPVIWTDGHYSKDFAADDKVMRDLVWWAYTSGARGHINGSEGVWGWGSGALAEVSSESWSAVVLPVIQDYFSSLPGWFNLVPDTGSVLVTAGRGTHASSLTPGGSGGVYDSLDPQDTYVTASVTPDGSLAVVYCPVATTVTVDDGVLAASYTATWVDPADPTQTQTATPSGDDYTTPGTNSVGDDDWLLVFQGT
jgi:hypothetical protein